MRKVKMNDKEEWPSTASSWIHTQLSSFFSDDALPTHYDDAYQPCSVHKYYAWYKYCHCHHQSSWLLTDTHSNKTITACKILSYLLKLIIITVNTYHQVNSLTLNIYIAFFNICYVIAECKVKNTL